MLLTNLVPDGFLNSAPVSSATVLKKADDTNTNSVLHQREYRLQKQKRKWSLSRQNTNNESKQSYLERRSSFPVLIHSKQVKQEMTAPVMNNESWWPSSFKTYKRSRSLRFWKSEDDCLQATIDSIDLSLAADVDQIAEIVEGRLQKRPYTATELAEILQNIYSAIDLRVKRAVFNGSLTEEEGSTSATFEERLMHRLHVRIFDRILEEEEDSDRRLSERIENLYWVTAEHLAAKIDESEAKAAELLDKAMLDIAAMNFKESPIEKLDCVMDCSRRIFDILRLKPGSSECADDFLPILVYVVLQANPAHLHSNVRYVLQFGNADKVVKGEEGYYFTHLCSVVSFIENLSASSLNLSEEEFERCNAPRSNGEESELRRRTSSCSRHLSQCICKVYNKAAFKQREGKLSERSQSVDGEIASHVEENESQKVHRQSSFTKICELVSTRYRRKHSSESSKLSSSLPVNIKLLKPEDDQDSNQEPEMASSLECTFCEIRNGVDIPNNCHNEQLNSLTMESFVISSDTDSSCSSSRENSVADSSSCNDGEARLLFDDSHFK